MANNGIEDWIKQSRLSGISDLQLQEMLKKNGYTTEQAQAFLKVQSKEINSSKDSIYTIKFFFKPTTLKLLIPVFILILFMTSFYLNYTYLPSVGESTVDLLNSQYNAVNTSKNYAEIMHRIDASPNDVEKILQNRLVSISNHELLSKELSRKLPPVIIANIPLADFYLFSINHFFPKPCEFIAHEKHSRNLNYCRYFVAEKDVSAIISIESSYSQQANNIGGGLRQIFSTPLPEYKKVSFISWLMQSIFVSFIVFIMICIISLIFTLIKSKSRKIHWLTLFVFIFTALFFLYSIEDMDKYYVWITIFCGVALTYCASIFIISDKISKIVILSLFILALVISPIALNARIDRVNPNGPEYEKLISKPNLTTTIYYCNESRNLTDEEKVNRGINKSEFSEVWNVCINPTCIEYCRDLCPNISNTGLWPVSLRGDKPSCVCGCLVQ